jgi:hypothetical protein
MAGDRFMVRCDMYAIKRICDVTESGWGVLYSRLSV